MGAAFDCIPNGGDCRAAILDDDCSAAGALDDFAGKKRIDLVILGNEHAESAAAMCTPEVGWLRDRISCNPWSRRNVRFSTDCVHDVEPQNRGKRRALVRRTAGNDIATHCAREPPRNRETKSNAARLATRCRFSLLELLE